MTQYKIIGIFITAIVMTISMNSNAASHRELSSAEKQINASAATTPVEPVHNSADIPLIPATHSSKSHDGKSQPPRAEELAHIHHFHKERVKKIKRHHEKFWFLSQVLLVICHLLILLMAYTHVFH
jgi:hypothetical protein